MATTEQQVVVKFIKIHDIQINSINVQRGADIPAFGKNAQLLGFNVK
jgi:hypothetical protein